MATDYLAMLKQKQQEAEKASKEQKTSTGTTKPKKEEKPKKAKEAPKEEYTYPFSMYTEGRTVDISAYGFEDNKAYTPKEICDIMLQHRHYEFAGEMSFKLFKDDNMLVATSKQYKKG
jgi:hypothetical protein